MKNVLLSIKNLSVYFHSDKKELRAVNNVSFEVLEGETFGIVGESGCGKSVTSMSILRLVPEPPAQYAGGQILFQGQDTLQMNTAQLRRLRGNDISVIFQEPMTALNPVYTIGDQMEEAIMVHTKVKRDQAQKRCLEMLRKVCIPNPEQIYCSYPHTLSGGMRQRVMIAMALLMDPKIIIADEPTTALDVTIQAQVLDVMNTLKAELGMSCIFITHDLGVISEMADRVMVMYGGRVCEIARVEQLFESPLHPYTRSLIASRPSADTQTARLPVIPGNVPSLKDMPAGCPFHTRCDRAMEICSRAFPPKMNLDEHRVACWLYPKGGEEK